MKRCDHDQIFSGQTNLSQRFAWICRKCGETGWSERYVLAQVHLEEYHHLRVVHGWAGPPRLPAPPRVPTNTAPDTGSPLYAWSAWFFATLAALLALCGVAWPSLGSILPRWQWTLGSGLCLGIATFAYVAWKKWR